MVLIIVSFLIGASAIAGIFVLTLKSLAAKAEGGGGSDLEQREERSSRLSENIEQALAYLGAMVPLADAVEREQQIAGLRQDLAGETKKLQDLEAQLGRLQGMVETAEQGHSELKKGKEDCDTLADEIRTRKDQLNSEASRLESEIAQSRAQLSMLSEEVTLTKEQKAALNSITAALDHSQKQVTALAEIWTVASNRFVNLETQYSELEKEFTKLVEKELSGKTG